MKRYVGTRSADGVVVVVVTGETAVAPLNPRNDLYNHSPDGFEWGYGGSGPAQLALAILADHLAEAENAEERHSVAMAFDVVRYGRFSLSDRTAVQLHQRFKWRVIAPMQRDDAFELTESEVSVIVRELVNERAT